MICNLSSNLIYIISPWISNGQCHTRTVPPHIVISLLHCADDLNVAPSCQHCYTTEFEMQVADCTGHISIWYTLSRTADGMGRKTLHFSTNRAEKASFTVLLLQKKDPVYSDFYAEAFPKEQFRRVVIVQTNGKGWMNKEMMRVRIKSCSISWANRLFKPKSVMIIDTMHAHICDSAKDSIQ